jgi:glucose/arabinose dehydrogenase
MKTIRITVISLILMLALAACGSAPVEQNPAVAPVEPTAANVAGTPQAEKTPAPQSATSSGLNLSYENALSTRLALSLGMLKLEETEHPVTQEQAPMLLMLWQGLVNLSSSGSSAEAEVNALMAQIEATLSVEQIDLINEMKLTQTDTQAWAQDNGITLGTGTSSGTGMGQGQGSSLSAEEKATRQAANNPTGDSTNRENSLSNALSQALIAYLESKIE